MVTHKEYLDLVNEYYSKEKETDKPRLLQSIKDYNIELISEYPFLLPRDSFFGEIVSDFDYTYSLLDDMPNGWRIAFADDFLKELKEELVKFNCLNDYRITTIKEKYGELRWYDNGSPIGELSEVDKIEISDKYKWPIENTDKDFWHYVGKTEDDKFKFEHRTIIDKCRVNDIVHKYTILSRKMCINCGKPAKYISKGWISPYCEDCAKEILEEQKNYYKEDIDISFYFNEVKDD